MTKILYIIPCLLILSGCAVLNKYEKPNCYKSVAIAKISVKEAHSSAAKLTLSGKIKADKSKKSYLVLVEANHIIDSASALCSLNEVTAMDYIDQAYNLINNASDIMKELN